MSKPCRELSDEESLRGAALGITEVTEPQIRGVSGNKAGEEKLPRRRRNPRKPTTEEGNPTMTIENNTSDQMNDAPNATQPTYTVQPTYTAQEKRWLHDGKILAMNRVAELHADQCTLKGKAIGAGITFLVTFAATAAVELIFGHWLFRPAVTPEALLTGVPIPKKQ